MYIGDKKKHLGNTVINKFTDYIELVYYKEPFEYHTGSDKFMDKETGEVFKREIDRSRKFIEKDGILHPLYDGARIEDYQSTIRSSGKRAMDNFYGYALCNEWRYFITLTYSPQKVNKDDEEELKYCWQLFREKIQRRKKDVTIICVPERHKSGKIHLHALIGNIDLTEHLTKARNPKNNRLIKSKYGQQVYNISLWDYGFTTVVELQKDYNTLQVANYLISYVTKQASTGYNKKKYYRTHNLMFKDKDISLLTQTELTQLTNTLSCKVHKDNDKLTVYRIDKRIKL